MHAVIKDSSTTTKLRVVFDASARTTSGHSNETLMTDPTLYPPLTDILMRFRTFPVAISGDVSKMYRAIELSPEDRDYHSFVWRADKSSPAQDFRMKRVTFGVTASPFVAIRCLQQTSQLFGHEHNLAQHHVYESFYVDDLLVGASAPEDALQLQQHLRALLLKGGFDLRKWCSNSSQVLSAIPTELHEPSQIKTLSQDSTSHSKALGIFWDAQNDLFYVATGAFTTQAVTKRSITSDVARFFDVLGWLAPATILLKVLLQRLWETKAGWDEEVPPDLQQQHSVWRQQLPAFSKFPFKCFYFTPGGNYHSHRTPRVFGRVRACLLCSSIHQGYVLECSSLYDTSYSQDQGGST